MSLSKEQGISLLELAIALPLLLLLITIIINLGFIINDFELVASASREGARAASDRSLDITLPCGAQITVDCASPPSATTISAVAAVAGCTHLQDIGADVTAFETIGRVESTILPSSEVIKNIRLTVRRKASRPSGPLDLAAAAFGPILSGETRFNLSPSTSSTFLINGQCT